MNWLGKLALGIVAVVAIVAGGIAAIDYRPSDDRIRLRARQGYSDGAYMAYVQPWGAPSGLFDLWARRADSIRVDPGKFPDRTRISWRWPPFGPPGALSIWGYDHIAYGNYDGGEVEAKVTPVRVKEAKVFKQSFEWSGDFAMGDGTLLTEFYLRSDPADLESKTLEVGWFLHAPALTKKFLAEGKQLGRYRDPHGDEWRAVLNDKYLTFSSPEGKDMTKGSLDMLALRWLQRGGHISGEEWITGLAVGVEPMSGAGHVEIKTWVAKLSLAGR